VKPQSGELTLDTLNLGSALFIGTLISRLLQLATSWTLNRSGQIAPCGPKALLVTSGIDVAVLTAGKM
jgi:hypothetical protein